MHITFHNSRWKKDSSNPTQKAQTALIFHPVVLRHAAQGKDNYPNCCHCNSYFKHLNDTLNILFYYGAYYPFGSNSMLLFYCVFFITIYLPYALSHLHLPFSPHTAITTWLSVSMSSSSFVLCLSISPPELSACSPSMTLSPFSLSVQFIH